MGIAKKLTALMEWRDRTDSTQGDVGRLMGVSDAIVSRWENGLNPIPIEQAVKLSLFTGIQVADLVSDQRAVRLLKLLSKQTSSTEAIAGD